MTRFISMAGNPELASRVLETDSYLREKAAQNAIDVDLSLVGGRTLVESLGPPVFQDPVDDYNRALVAGDAIEDRVNQLLYLGPPSNQGRLSDEGLAWIMRGLALADYEGHSIEGVAYFDGRNDGRSLDHIKSLAGLALDPESKLTVVSDPAEILRITVPETA